MGSRSHSATPPLSDWSSGSLGRASSPWRADGGPPNRLGCEWMRQHQHRHRKRSAGQPQVQQLFIATVQVHGGGSGGGSGSGVAATLQQARLDRGA